MRYSVWNPASQSRLLSAHTNLVQVGDLAIDAARARLIADEQWRQKVAQFNSQAQEAHNAIKAAAESAYTSAQQDLSATNEAERELIAAAQSIQKSQSRLVSFKSQAQEQQATKGSTYIGVDIIDVSAPILNSAAKLVEAAQAQTKYVLQRQPDLTNTKGLVNTARNLVDSLELLLIAAEAIVNKIRAFYPDPGTYFVFNGEKIKLGKAKVIETNHQKNSATILTYNKNEFIIACKENALSIELLQKPGKKMMDYKSFFNGNQKLFKENELIK